MRLQLLHKELLDQKSQEAKTNARLRINHNFHQNESEVVNRLLNAMEPGTYVRPHRHTQPEKVEACVVLRGEVDLLIFDKEGKLLERHTINPSVGQYGFDIEPGIWHGLIVNLPNTVLYEVKTGPYTPIAETDWAAWAPEVNDTEGIQQFLSTFAKKQ